MSLIDYNVLEEIIPNVSKMLHPQVCKYSGIIGVTGNKKLMEGVISLDLKIGTVHCKHLFYVIRDMQPEIILGRDFLQKYECHLDFSSNTLRSRPLLKLHLVSTVRVPAGGIATCRAGHSNRLHFMTGTVMEVYKTKVKPNLFTQPSLSQIHHKTMTVQILNNTAVEQIFHRNSFIATARPLNASEEVNIVTIVSPSLTEQHKMPFSQSEVHKQLFPQFYTEAINTESKDHSSKPSNTAIELNPDNCLSPNGKLKFQEILSRRRRAFVGPSGQLGKCELYEVKVQLKDGAQPFRKRPYRLAPHIQREAQKQIDKFLLDGVLEECDSAYSSPLLVVTKGQKRSHQHMKVDKSKLKYRIVVDLRELNSQIVNTTRLVPNPEELIDRVCQRYTDSTMAPRFFTSLDLKDSFYQIILHKDSRHLTAFEFNNRSYAFCRIPMGMNLSAGVLVKVINKILEPLPEVNVVAYLDDILIMSPDEDTHASDVEKVLQAFEQANLLLNPKKCSFAVSQTEFLGFTLTKDGISPSDKHIAALKLYQPCKSVKDVRVLLGLINFFKKHIPDKATLCKPLNDLTRKDAVFSWSPLCQQNFEKLINILTTPPVLAYPRFNEQFYLATDASTTALGGVLTQYSEKLQTHTPVGYCGRALNKHEQNYSITKLELLAVIYCVLHFRVYLQNPSKPFILYTDHSALTSILARKPLLPQIARFSLILQSFEFKIVHVSGLLNSAADCLSRKEYLLKSDDITKLIDKYPDNQIMGRPSSDINAHQHIPSDTSSEEDEEPEFKLPNPSIRVSACNPPKTVRFTIPLQLATIDPGISMFNPGSPEVSDLSESDTDDDRTSEYESFDTDNSLTDQEDLSHSHKQYPISVIKPSTSDLSQDFQNARHLPVIPFHGAQHVFSNLYHIPNGIKDEGHIYYTVEHAYQARKVALLQQHWLLPIIQQTTDPILAKQCVNYELDHVAQRLPYEKWNRVKTPLMAQLLLLKLSSLPLLHDTLVNTYGIIAEGTTNIYWGTGHNVYDTSRLLPRQWLGRNQMGNLLMNLRTKLRTDDSQCLRMTTESKFKLAAHTAACEHDKLNQSTHQQKCNVLDTQNLAFELNSLYPENVSATTNLPHLSKFKTDLFSHELPRTKLPNHKSAQELQTLKPILKIISQFDQVSPNPLAEQALLPKLSDNAEHLDIIPDRLALISQQQPEIPSIKTRLRSSSGNQHQYQNPSKPQTHTDMKIQQIPVIKPNDVTKSHLTPGATMQENDSDQQKMPHTNISQTDQHKIYPDLLLPDERNLMEDSKLDSTVVHRYNLRPTRKLLPTTQAQRRDTQLLTQRIMNKPDLITSHTDISRNEIRAEQIKDEHCFGLIQYITQNILPMELTIANNIINLASYHLYIDEILYKIHYFKKSTGLPSRLKLVVPKTLATRIILLNHVNPRNAHQGVVKTLLLLSERYSWNQMVNDVRDVIGSCDHCLQYKRSQRTEDPPMILQEQTHAPWERVVFDLLGPLALSNNRNSYVLICVDTYSRYLIAVPLRNKNAETVAKAFYTNVIAVFGAIKYLHSDRGGEMVNAVMTQLTSMYGITQTKSSGYHSHSSGLAESGVKRLVAALRTIADKKPKDWDKHIPSLLFAINATPTQYSAHSPYLLMFGRLPFLPSDHITQPEGDNINIRSEFLRDIITTHTMIAIDSANNKAKTNQNMKTYFDKHRKDSSIKIGDFVYLKTPVAKGDISRKLAPFFQGPFIITDLLPWNRVAMKNLHTDKPYSHPMHISRLKLASRYRPEMSYKRNTTTN